MDCKANGMKLECTERFLQYRDNPELGNEWLLCRVEDYLTEVDKRRAELDRAEKYLTDIRSSLTKPLRKKLTVVLFQV